MKKKQKRVLVRIIICILAMIVAAFLPITGTIRFAVYFAVYILIGYDVLYKAFKGFISGRIFDENFLMAIATVGAFALAIYERSGDYNEAIAVMLFYQIGELFQSYAVGKSRRNISELMDIRPDYANIEENGALIRVDPESLETGSEIIVNPGEKIPIDGIIIDGASTLNTSALTGESLPKDVSVGETVISGCINMTGVLKIKTTKEFSESTVSKILELVENASSRKSKSEHFISKFASVYTPIVCCSALVLAIIPPLVRLMMGLPAGFDGWIYRALTFLVISCPCALVISIPLSFFAGIGGASREGILIKGSNYLETLSETKIVVFDKTGTLTEGSFEVTGLHHLKIDERVILELAAHAECSSSHPISQSLKSAFGGEIDRKRVNSSTEYSGEGIIAFADEKKVAVGNDKLMKRIGAGYIPCHDVGTIVHVALDGEYVGHIVISDRVKKTAAEAIKSLKNCGIEKTVMLSGDSESAAVDIADKLGIDEVHGELLPSDKVAKLEQLLHGKSGNGKLAFVGDGINDAPVLSRADIGIAMGAMGSDAAIEAADIVLMDDDPMKISKAIKISKKCIGIVRENTVFAIGVKFICLVLGALGMASMWLAIFADVGVMVIAVLNAIRALFVKKL